MKKMLTLVAALFAAVTTTALADEYTIHDLEELQVFMEYVHSYDFLGDTIYLAADIDCQGGRFNTGDPENYSTFAGTFDGQGHTISNFVHTPAGSGNYGYGVAMFDYAETGATIRNLTLEGSLPQTHLGAYSAPFVLAAEGPLSLLMENCHFRGVATNYKHAGGLVGFASPGAGFEGMPSVILTNCTVEADVLATGYYIAGGLVAKGTGVQAYDCSVSGYVYAQSNAGGLFAEAFNCTVERCSFSGRLDGGPTGGSVVMPRYDNYGCGGLVGFASNSVFRACSADAENTWTFVPNGGITYEFTAPGGAAGLTLGETAFFDCTATGSIDSRRCRAGGFVGWTAGSETFSNCTTSVSLNPDKSWDSSAGNGGFAYSVASSGALFVDCATSSRGNDVAGGFFADVRLRKVNGANLPAGRNAFLRCTVTNLSGRSGYSGSAGFANIASNMVFTSCTVAGGRADRAGFTGSSKGDCYYTNCVVRGMKAPDGFVAGTTGTNVFKSCRASGVFGGWRNGAFAGALNRFSLAEDCAGYGVSDDEANGFAGVVSTGATVRRCVGALLPFPSEPAGSGFADTISYDSVVEDCYSVYAPTLIPRYAGQQGGFVLETSLGISSSLATSSGTDKLARCFALGVIPGPTLSGNGSFCGGTPGYPRGATYNVRFEDCYRPAESPVADFNGQDHAGVGALTKAEFASATSATMPHYDFDHVWHAPNGVASSPYLDASTDANGKFWFYGTLLSGEGRILVNGAEPAEAYPAGARIKVKAVCDTAGMPFTGWVGEGFDDPTAQETWYTVKNVSAIAATFGTPIYTVDDWTNHISRVSEPSGTYALMNDLDFSEFIASNDWEFVRVTNFKGKLFGQGHTIRGLTWNGAYLGRWAGLFSSYTGAGEAPAVWAGAEIRDLNVESVVSSNFTGNAAGLVSDVRSDCLISNCHAKVDFHGGYIDRDVRDTSQFYGLVGWAEGTNIRIVDCSAEGTMIGGIEVAGFIGSANLTDGEIARCSAMGVFCATNSEATPYGRASGFAATIYLSGGATVRECFSAGVVDGVGDAAGFASDKIELDDAASCVRDCYSTAEVIGGYNRDIAGFAVRVTDYNDDDGVTVSNCWFGGSVRAHGGVTGSYKPRGFAKFVDNDVAFPNCRWVRADAATVGTDGVGELDRDEARARASWAGYDFGGVWSLDEGYTSPYFAWSVSGRQGVAPAGFRIFADEAEGTTIAHPATATPGDFAEISADPGETDLFFCQWAGGAAYTNAAVNPSAILADNHRAVRAAWAKAITNRAELEAVTNDPAGTYGLACDIDLGGEPWTPIGSDESTAFTGTLYGQGHAISNLVVDTDGGYYAGLFGYVKGGKVADLVLAGADVAGGSYSGALAGYLDGAAVEDVVVADSKVRGGGLTGGLAGRATDSVVTDCFVEGADVASTGGERTGMFVGEAYGGAKFARCRVNGTVASPSGYVGGFAGYADSAAFSQCCALGTVTATGGQRFGGFVGYAGNDSTSFSECFACGAVAASGRESVGGFAGYVGDDPAFSDCYSLVDVTGGSYVGGFVGQTSYCEGTFTRCYAAGATAGSSDVGGFVGRNYSSSYNPTYANCFRIDDGLADVGAADLSGIDALDAAGFLDADNFPAYHATDKWAQVDGKTQPYLAWGLVDGKMTLTGTTAGTGRGAVRFYDGDGNEGTAFAPGETVTLVAEPDGSVFLEWLGNAPYANPSEQTTTVALDNFRIVTAQFGKLIMNVADLHNVTNALSGSFALGANIDLSNETWTPIGSSSTPFTGSLHGQGYAIMGLSFDNTANSDTTGGKCAGLFRYAKDATFVGVVLTDVDLNGYQYVGALAGEVQGATTVRDCYASGTVKSSNGCVGMLVGRVYNATGTVFEDCMAGGAVESAGASVGGLVGDIASATVSFTGCSTDVAVSGTGGNYKGGLVGYIESGGSASFADCWTEGDVTAPNSDYVGGFIGNATRPVFCDNCQTFGATSGKNYTGGFAGQASGEGSVFADCVANGGVTTANGSQAGGFVGNASGARSRYENCSAWGTVSAGSGSQVGGFVGQCTAAGVVFEDCLARGTDVRTTGSAVGGFAGKSSSSNDFTRCQAKALTVSGSGSVGGFIGSAEGSNSQYAECEAHGSVKATSYPSGGFAGQSTGGGNRFARCSAFGGVSSSSYRVGGFVGYVSSSNDLWRCMSAGSATGTYEVGGFAGNFSGNTAVRECFALGDATATQNGDAYAGGFAGDLYATTFLSDSYCLGTVKGQQKIGGFAGRNYNASTRITRCYAAGAVECSGTYAGAFIGYNQSAPTFTDCAVLAGGFHAIGSGTAGSSAEIANVAEFSAAEFYSADNFQTWLDIDDEDGSVWTQADGVTQPYLAWSSPDGDLMVYASIGGSASGRIDGAGIWYAPGDDASVTAVPDDSGFFVKWTGSTPYASRMSPTTTIKMDNHRVAAALLGKLITTPDELDAVRSDLAGVYGLGNDIDLAGRDWTPIGNDSTKFSGSFYGRGYAVKNLTCTNNWSNYNSKWRGLFGCTLGATLDGVTVANCDVAGYQYLGALVGRAYAGTSVSGCSASGKVHASNSYVGGLVGYAAGTAFSDCSAAVEVTSASTYVGGLVGCVEGGSSLSRCSASGSVVSTGSTVGGLIGACDSGNAMVTVSGCRADGFVSGNGHVGGFVGYVSKPVLISGCAARGDVKSTGDNMGGFIGYLGNTSATNANCWSSGAVWGTGSNCGSFLGKLYSGTVLTNCAVAASANGIRPFCGNGNASGTSLSDTEITQNSAGWPKVAKRSNSASLTRIATAADLLAIASSTANFSGGYVLTADIDLGGAAWTPIGNSSTGFTGEFYGKNHVISNFVVNTSATCAGLFGSIAGGRVEGVQAFGTVTSTSDQVGGFAGRIHSRSLVNGCSFVGTVSSSSTKVGGFAGYIYDQPSVFECCAVGTVAKTGSANNYAYVGGFVGHHYDGYVADSYAQVAVVAGTSGRVGGFTGQLEKGTIARTYCSGSVGSTSTTYVGAFGGNISANIVTNSYYNLGATAQLAAGRNGSVAVAYVGIDPIAAGGMKNRANFSAFDFNADAVWAIEEGVTMPYLHCFYVFEINCFADWLYDRSLPAGSQPGDIVGGLELGARYVFGIDSMNTVLNESNEPVFCVKFDETGAPYVQFARQVRGEGEVTFEVIATTDVTDWSHAVPVEVDLEDGRYIPDVDPVPPAMFFRWRMHMAGYE